MVGFIEEQERGFASFLLFFNLKEVSIINIEQEPFYGWRFHAKYQICIQKIANSILMLIYC